MITKSFSQIVFLLILMAEPLAGATATATGSLSSPQPVGTGIAWTATYSGTQSAGVAFRWSVAVAGGMPRTVRDYSRAANFTYTPLNEGAYTVTVDVRDASGNPIATGSTTYSATSLLGSSSSPAATATSNPLVAIYSTVCKAGKVRVHFAMANQPIASGMTTPYYECQGARSTNILIAGMRANMAYVMQEEVDGAQGHQTGSRVTFQTGSLPSSLNLPPLAEITGKPSAPESVMLISTTDAFAPEVQLPAAYDLAGNLIWYYSDPDTAFFNFFRGSRAERLLALTTMTVRACARWTSWAIWCTKRIRRAFRKSCGVWAIRQL